MLIYHGKKTLFKKTKIHQQYFRFNNTKIFIHIIQKLNNHIFQCI